MAGPDLDLFVTTPVVEPDVFATDENVGRDRVVGTALLAGGVVALLVAGVVISPDTLWRAALAIVGLGMLWGAGQTFGRLRFGRDFSLGVWLSVIWIALVLIAAALASVLPIEDYTKTVLADRLARPGLELSQPLGRDINGTSLLTQVIYGSRTSLTIVVMAVGLGLTVGCFLGLIAGYFGRFIDAVINIFATATLAFPALILLFAIVAVFKASTWSLAIGLAILSIPTYTRLMRAQTISLLDREFIVAARAMGASRWRIIFREILPNAILPVASFAFLSAAVVIVAEGSLAYLGLGVPPPRPSWGTMIADGQQNLKTDPHLVFVPATVMFLTVLAFNRLGDWVRKKVLGESKI